MNSPEPITWLGSSSRCTGRTKPKILEKSLVALPGPRTFSWGRFLITSSISESKGESSNSPVFHKSPRQLARHENWLFICSWHWTPISITFFILIPKELSKEPCMCLSLLAPLPFWDCGQSWATRITDWLSSSPWCSTASPSERNLRFVGWRELLGCKSLLIIPGTGGLSGPESGFPSCTDFLLQTLSSILFKHFWALDSRVLLDTGKC